MGVGLISNPFLQQLPFGFQDVSAVFMQNNLAVIPTEWTSPGILSSFYDITVNDQDLGDALAQAKNASFIGWDPLFFDLIGPDAQLEQIQSFEEPSTHEAPAYIPETNELLYSDTSAIGWLWAVNIDTHQSRQIQSTPPLHNVNGARYHKGTVYLSTNGGASRGIHVFNITDGTSTPVVNNYRGRHLNSPNDLVFDSSDNIWFTDPPYGWWQAFTDVQPPELPSSVYFFNTTSNALVAASNALILVPNGLDFSPDGSTLYVADSNSTSGRPPENYSASLRNVWAFDVQGSLLSNPRLVHQTETGWPDGLRVSQNGFLLIAVYGGVDIVDPHSGLLLGKINTPDDIIYNLERGPSRGGQRCWLLTGQNNIYKVLISER